MRKPKSKYVMSMTISVAINDQILQSERFGGVYALAKKRIREHFASEKFVLANMKMLAANILSINGVAEIFNKL